MYIRLLGVALVLVVVPSKRGTADMVIVKDSHAAGRKSERTSSPGGRATETARGYRDGGDNGDSDSEERVGMV
jgi:hypothetical protein